MGIQNLKVKFTNKRLWREFIKIVSAVTAVLSIVLTVIDIDQKPRIIIATIIVLILIITFMVMWVLANKKDSQNLKINETDINIMYGDIFNQRGVKVIAFNEFFDTQVDNKIISENSLNGIYINHHSPRVEAIDNAINSEPRLKKAVIEENVNRLYGGKTTRYRLGSICPVDDYFLLAFSHFDEDNKAYISVQEYISCLMRMWDELDKYYAGRPISVTLLGGGITRFNSNEIAPQDLLKYIVMTFKASKVKFNNTSSLSIVLDKHVRDEINLYDIQED